MNISKSIFVGLLLTFLLSSQAQAESACNTACTAAEIAGEAACALEIFGEPECGLAVAAAAALCHTACSAASASAVTNTQAGQKPTGLCTGKVPVLNKELAAKFCKKYK